MKRPTRRRPRWPPVVTDPVAAAEAASLRYVSDRRPGIRRRRRGRGFLYLDAGGRPIREPAELARIRALAIPPAWTQVWICPSARGHILATGRDARRRKQYRYHPRWRVVRDALHEEEPAHNPRHGRRCVVRAVTTVAERLRNTPAICRKSYVHPAVIDAYLDGSLGDAMACREDRGPANGAGRLRPEEQRVLEARLIAPPAKAA